MVKRTSTTPAILAARSTFAYSGAPPLMRRGAVRAIVALPDLAAFEGASGSALGFSETAGDPLIVSPTEGSSGLAVVVTGTEATDVSAPGDSGSERAVCAPESDGVSGCVTIASSSFEATAWRLGGGAERAGAAPALRISLIEGGVERTSVRSSEAEAAVGEDDVAETGAETVSAATSGVPDGGAGAACGAAAVRLPADAHGCSPALNDSESAFRVMNALLTATPTPTRISGIHFARRCLLTSAQSRGTRPSDSSHLQPDLLRRWTRGLRWVQ